MEINEVLRTNNKFHPNSLNVLHEFVMIIWWVYYSFWGHQFQKGNKVGNVHAIRFGLLYSFIIVVWWL
jgi:hypothetical protein